MEIGFSEATRRLSYPRVLDYCRPLSTIGVGLLGLTLLVAFLPAWRDGVWLPHPLLGALAVVDVAWRTRARWRTFRGLEVELYPEGFRILVVGEPVRSVFCEDVYQLHQTRQSVTFYAAGQPVELDAGWPGQREVVQHLIRYAGLADRTPPTPLVRRLMGASRYYERMT